MILIPCIIGALYLSLDTKKNYDFSHYISDGAPLDFTVPLAEDTVEIPFTYQPLPFVLKNYTGFKEAVGFKESQGRYQVVNRFGYLGKYQFGQSTLDLLGIDEPDFLGNPLLQEQAFLLNASRNKWVLRRDIKRFDNRWMNGVRVTESGILAAAHLAGPGSVKKFLRSGGQIGFSDAFGTSITSYLRRFSGYDVSNIEADKRPSLEKLKDLYKQNRG